MKKKKKTVLNQAAVGSKKKKASFWSKSIITWPIKNDSASYVFIMEKRKGGKSEG